MRFVIGALFLLCAPLLHAAAAKCARHATNAAVSSSDVTVATKKNGLVGDSPVWHIHFVDSNADNSTFLFRGGNPDVDDQGNDVDYFNYDILKSSIAVAAGNSGVTLPDDYYLIDLNLLNFNSDNDINNTLHEQQWFTQNPKQGEFVFWHTLGTYDNATLPAWSVSKEADALRQQMAATIAQWLPDPMEARTLQMIDMVHNTKYPQPVVIYGHCDCGCDRTGQTFGSYYLRRLNMSWQAVNELNTEIAGRGMSCNDYLAMQWYCLYLNTIGYNYDCLTNYACSP